MTSLVTILDSEVGYNELNRFRKDSHIALVTEKFLKIFLKFAKYFICMIVLLVHSIKSQS